MKTDHQQFLFPYAYNILGSVDDALDAVQDVLLKYISHPKDEIKDERNYLIKSVINQAINVKNRNKRFVKRDDVWLPEPVATEEADLNIHRKEILSYSLMVLLESLNAHERAVFILREGFDYTHQEIADTLDFSIENSRKLLSRAKTKISKKSSDKHSLVSTKNKQDTVHLNNYMEALRSGDMAQVEKLLWDDVVFYADGGSKLKVVKSQCSGATEVANLLIHVYQNYHTHYRLVVTEVNHNPALFYYDRDQLRSCQVFDISPQDGKIIQIHSIVDPNKLNRFSS